MASSPWPADEAPSTAVGDVSELGDVDMDEVTRLRVFIAAHRLAGGPIGVGQAVETAPDEHSVGGRGCNAAQCGQLQRSKTLAQPQRHHSFDHRLGRFVRAGGRP